MSAVHVHEVEEAFVTPRVSTDGGLLPADGAALRARVFPSPWCSVCGVELMSAGVFSVARSTFSGLDPSPTVPSTRARAIASFSLDGASRKGKCHVCRACS